MPQDESKEINARLLHYECQLEAERKLNRIYQAQIRYARVRESEQYQREIEREVKLQQVYLGYDHISTYRFERLVATSNYPFEAPVYRIKKRNKAARWQRPQGLLRQLIKALMTKPRGLIQLCMTRIQKAYTTTKKVSTG
jgi:hypothetical protein